MRAIAALLLLVGCSDSEDDPTPELSWLPPAIALGERLLLIDREGDGAFSLDATVEASDDLAGAVRAAPTPPNPFLVAARSDSPDEALLLSAGKRGVAEPSSLSLVSSRPRLQTWSLPGPYNALAQSADGDYAVTYFQRGSDHLVFNAAELAIVDLNDDDAAAQRRQVPTGGGAIDRVAMSDEIELGDEELRILVILAGNEVSLVDAEDSRREGTRITLTSVPGFRGEQVFVHESLRQVYLRGSGVDDIFVLSLEARRDSDKGRNRFATRVHQLPAGGAPTDMAWLPESEQLAVVGGDRLRLIDPVERSHLDVALDEPTTRIALVGAGRDGQDRLLLYSPGGTAISLVNIEEGGETSFDLLRLNAPITEITVHRSVDRALVRHADGLVSLVDLERQSAALLNLPTQDAHLVVEEGYNQAYVVTPHLPLLGVLDLDSGESREVLLDHPIAGLTLLPEAERIAVVHDHPQGAVTLLDADDPRRQNAVQLNDFRER